MIICTSVCIYVYIRTIGLKIHNFKTLFSNYIYIRSYISLRMCYTNTHTQLCKYVRTYASMLAQILHE